MINNKQSMSDTVALLLVDITRAHAVIHCSLLFTAQANQTHINKKSSFQQTAYITLHPTSPHPFSKPLSPPLPNGKFLPETVRL